MELRLRINTPVAIDKSRSDAARVTFSPDGEIAHIHGDLTIGREGQLKVIPVFSTVSRIHCTLEHKFMKGWTAQAEGKNGLRVLVNGAERVLERGEKIPLERGMTLKFTKGEDLNFIVE